MLRSPRQLISLSAKAAEIRAAANLALAQDRARALSTLAAKPKAPRYHIVPARYARVLYSTKIPVGIDKERDKEVARQKLQADPEAVTSTSTVRGVLEESGRESPSNDEVTRGLKSDLKTVKDTFDLSSVPSLSYKLGLAGTLPYLGTSLSTLYLGWNLNAQWSSNALFNTLLLKDATAQSLLQQLEAIQLGYGAVIISFLGAIHWGLEYGATTIDPKRTRFRYALGVAAPAIAWPTLLMPVEYALIGQFGAFMGLYYFDAHASTRGWAPPWYGTYRFVLTFVVGSAIMVSLIGRARIGEGGNKEAAERIRDAKHGRTVREMSESEWRRLEAEEKEKIRKEKEEAERKQKEEEKEKQKDKKKQDKGGKEDKQDKDDKGKEKQQKGDKSSEEESGEDDGDEGEKKD
ncbi:hypothetical protein MAPG_08478 [Magnaporthiopsis poae ATCC 64411]|uniref:Mitochondrial inner membrane protein 1 n=1 Tax=Magnaporthiopsis poae (strain ATCC 64411 / 73-15) TaxID=644358 RepID=A0A0C4E7G5_MAGP6|nr:hypothetical protein MAPG_08478 [Magnaporthiopsis poae ATCC 64411]